MRPVRKRQELSCDHPDSKWMFDLEADIALAITPAARAIYNDYACELLAILTELAKRRDRLDRLPTFMFPEAVESYAYRCPTARSYSICRRRTEANLA